MEVFLGYWNGEPAKYRVVNIQVGTEPKESTEHFEKHYPGRKRFLWFTAFLGKQRQAVEVHYGSGEAFYMDNETGLGVLKVTDGKGSPSYSHWSIYPEKGTLATPVPAKEWKKYDPVVVKNIQKEIDDYWMATDPEAYEENKKQVYRLRAQIEQSRKRSF
jgi:hypothetical protein